MLLAHLIPGYFLAAASQPRWDPTWARGQRRLLWAAALAGTVLPDADAIYNALVRGFFNHSTVWTHSLFVYLALGLAWWLLYRTGRWPYLASFAGLAGCLAAFTALFLAFLPALQRVAAACGAG